MALPSPPDVVLFDGDCRLCQRAARKLGALAKGQVELISFREESTRKRFPQVSLEACEQAIQLIRADGRVFSGAEAVVQLLRRRFWGPLVFSYYLPGIRTLSDALYRAVARRRFRRSDHACPSGVCDRRPLE